MQPDASHIPLTLPAPSKDKRVKYGPNTQSHYPTFVFECAVAQENRNRILEDTELK